jgi:hypothetical protein
MKRLLTEKTLAAILFVLVLITFSLAQNETKKIQQLYGMPASSIEQSTGPAGEAKLVTAPNASIAIQKAD